MRARLLSGNWKMNMTQKDAAAFCESFAKEAGLKKGEQPAVEILFAVPYPLLEVAKASFADYGVTVAAQNFHWEAKGAFTGEVSWTHLQEMKIDATLIGHSERRQYFGETNQTVNKKVHAALEQDLWPIVCVGETLEEREKGQTEAVIASQLRQLFNDVKKPGNLVIAYEPVWAIGTGKSATSAEAQQVHAFIRKEVKELYDQETADQMRILYGGSANPDNIAELISQPDVDGALVGGASLKPDQFAAMYRAMVS